MKKDAVVVLITIVIGSVIFAMGILLNDLIWNIIGGLLIVLSPILMNIKRKGDRKSLLDLIEKEDRPILSTRKTRQEFDEEEFWKKTKQYLEKIFILLIIAGLALGLVVIMLQRFILQPSYLSSEAAVNDGCALFNRGGCKGDPSEIIVNFDVNGDQVTGGTNDTLSNLLELYNCTGDCIKRRCGCFT